MKILVKQVWLGLAVVLLGAGTSRGQGQKNATEISGLIQLAAGQIDKATKVVNTGMAFSEGYGLESGESRVTSVDLGYPVKEVRLVRNNGVWSESGHFFICHFAVNFRKDGKGYMVLVRRIPVADSAEEGKMNVETDFRQEQRHLKLRMEKGRLVADYEQYPANYRLSKTPIYIPSRCERNVQLSPKEQELLTDIYETALKRAKPTLDRVQNNEIHH
jgi:hypothetical protein